MSRIKNIFPTALYTKKWPFESSLEMAFLNQAKLLNISIEKPETPRRSVNSYILNDAKCKRLRSFIFESIQDYSKIQFGMASRKFGITQSWIIEKSKGQRVNFHSHSNSLITCVFYWENHNPTVRLFHPLNPKSMHQFLLENNLNSYNKTIYSLTFIELKPKKNTLYLFPSFLPHDTEMNSKESASRALSINAVPLIFGSENSLTELDFRNIYSGN